MQIKRIIPLFTILLVILSNTMFSQVGIGTTTPNASAELDVTSTTKGFLVPRMTQAQRNAIAIPVAAGLQVWCSNCGTYGEAQVFNGTSWTNLIGGIPSVPAYPESAVFCASGPTVIINVTNPTTGKIWMDRNLGASQAATSSTDAASYGDLYQWGRRSDGHQCRTSVATVGTSVLTTPGTSFLTGSENWYVGTDPTQDNLWQDPSGINNPCPSGYRLPTNVEWEAERLSWVGGDNSAGAIGSFIKLPVAGYRRNDFGWLNDVGTYGIYWSSTISATTSRFLNFHSSFANTNITVRAHGASVRCLKN
jgi:hypothetical protein